MALCSAEADELPANFQLRRALKLLIDFKRINNKNIYNPYLFRGAPMVTTFVRSTGSRTKGVWGLIEKVNRAGIRLAEMDHPSLKKALSFFSGRVPVYVHLSFY